MAEVVRVCVVGAGRAGIVHARNLRWRVPNARLEAVVDVDGARGETVARELELEGASHTTLEEALDRHQIDAVVITTPTFSHAELACGAAARGLHVLCEKPMALTLAECDRMLEAAAQAGIVFQMAFMRRFDPAFVSAKRQIDEGLIGRPLIVRSLTRGPGLPPDWALDPSKSNGMLAEVNSHDFDTVRWLGGGNVVQVYAQAAALKEPALRTQYPAFYDVAVVTLVLDNGALGMLDGVCPAGYGYDARAEVVGSGGVLFIGEMREMALTRVTRDEGLAQPQFTSWPLRFRQAYLDEATHFVECIRRKEPPLVDGWDGRLALEAVIAANESIRTGQAVGLRGAAG